MPSLRKIGLDLEGCKSKNCKGLWEPNFWGLAELDLQCEMTCARSEVH